MGISLLIEQLIIKWKQIFALFLVGIVIAMTISFFVTPKYKTSFNLLIIQSQPSGMDLYTAAKTTEYVGNILSEVIVSQNFLNTVLATDSRIDKTYFKTDAEKRKKQWEKMVNAHVISNTGVIDVAILHEVPVQSLYVSQAIVKALTQSGQVYLGGTYSELKVLDEPITKKFPAQPNLFINAIIGAFMMVTLYIIFLFIRIPDIGRTEEYSELEVSLTT